MVLEQIIFFALSGFATLASLAMISLKDPVHSALCLVLTFFNLAGIYLLLGAEFLAAIQVLVYAGAIVVLFLFVMMLLQVRPGPSLYRLRFFQTRLAPLLALGFLAEVVLVVFASGFVLNGGSILSNSNTQSQTVAANVKYSTETMVPVTDANGNTIVTVDATGRATDTGIGLRENVTGGHSALLGKELYSTYLYPFEIASLILLIAAIGAIVIARRSLEFDVEDGVRVGGTISLAGAVQGSPQDMEARKRGKVAAGEERKLVMRK